MLHEDSSWLRKKYLDEGLSKQEIADLAGVTKSAIRWQLKKNGIKERSQSESMKGNKHSLGHRHTEESKLKMSKAMEGNKHFLGRRHTEASRKLMSMNMRGREFTEEHKQKLSENHRDMHGGNNHNWKGGISFEPYAPEFNDALRNRIRNRDGNVCLLCGSAGNGEKVQAHHIDYDRQNNDDLNLISLCRICNNRANSDRPKWQFFFESYQELRLMDGTF